MYGPNTQFGKDNPKPDLAYALEHYPSFQRSPGATNPTWGEAKNNQLRYGDEFLWDRTFQSGKGGQIGYDSTKFPILRCFWHTDEPDRQDNLAISNIALDGHHFRSHPKWEWVAVGIPPE
jgi:hypothetical protein